MNLLVTVICLNYNQKPFLRAAIQSVLDQRYSPIELIVVDDASTDGSDELINQLVASHPGIKFFRMKRNIGNCKAFNYGLQHAKGDFIIDLAADDILNVNRIEEGVKEFSTLPLNYGVNFTNAELIDTQGNHLSNFYHEQNGELKPKIAEGYVFSDLLKRYFICPPSLMFRKDVFDKLNGYDESLFYEDFDFLLRASKKFHFFYTDQILVKKRVVPGSLGHQQYIKGSNQLQSTFQILKKNHGSLDGKAEIMAWRKRVIYEARKAIQVWELKLAARYLKMLIKKP